MRRSSLALSAVLAVLLSCLTFAIVEQSPTAFGADGVRRGSAKGLDTCNAPIKSDMDAFYHNTNWWIWFVYAGGNTMFCANDRVDSDWVNHVVNTGWRIVLIWLGPQAPCTNFQHQFSSNTGTAFQQGQDVASMAYYHVVDDLNMNPDFAIAYDIEAFNISNDTCVQAAKAFIRGWVTFLHNSPAQKAGVYSSICGAPWQGFWSSSPKADFVWPAEYHDPPQPSTNVFHTPSECGAPGGLTSSQWDVTRHKQYRKNVSTTENGVTLVADYNCSRGPVYGAYDTTVDSACG
jgi:hypothetical protein